MTEYVIPCETIVRLANAVARPDVEGMDPRFRCIRIDNGVAVACNRKVLVAELLTKPCPPGVFYLRLDTGVYDVCTKEAVYASELTVVSVDAMRFATAKSMYGAVINENVGMWYDSPSDFDRWRERAELARAPATVPNGAMYWDMDEVNAIGRASPSGGIVFEAIPDLSRPVIIRDYADPNWFAMFHPFNETAHVKSASLPDWFK